ncbi:xaa-Arg dipeptidase [Rhipicephalus sanguineus]|uniref:xaa-Arg dipeptidase n=1 Tax=Rhipicephalus sanguineus TaxID=34632 RepID=UPI00189558C0|nr:xaa-Arg dipeptidase [Rhipicephalus sanguineus]
MEKYECVVEDAIDSRAAVLTSLGQYLWQNPEVAFAERKAHDYISDYLEKEGFQVVRKYVLPTAFRAEFGDGDVTAAFLCEYDALPGLGHACGHNLIAQGSVAAAVAVKEVLRQASLAGKVVMLGTPAEEGGGGKVHLLRGGAFDGIDYALMAHPSSRNVAACRTTAVTKYAVTYKGLPAHSAGAPWQGRNALDAAVAAYVNVAMLRQQVRPECRLSGIFRKGGDQPNIIPADAALEFDLRAPEASQLDELQRRVRACFDAGGRSAGCELSVEQPMPMYKNLVPNLVMAKVYRAYAEKQGLQFPDGDVSPASSASTDVGNVSHAIPTIQPYYALEAATSGGNHTEGFREASNDQRSYDVTLKVAKALALTAISVMSDSVIRTNMRKEFTCSPKSALEEERVDRSSQVEMGSKL